MITFWGTVMIIGCHHYSSHWTLIVAVQVQDLIDETILKKELNSRHADLWAIKRDLTLFTKSSTNTEQSNFLSFLADGMMFFVWTN